MNIADHLDTLLDMPTDARPGWLDALARHAPEQAQRLRSLMARLAQADAQGFLAAAAVVTGEVAEPSPHAAGERVGPWRLLRPLGAGGMAEVWLAERAAGDYERQVALKLTHAGGAALRFGRERDVMAGLDHPGIARLYDAGIDGGQPWIAMEYVEGRPLAGAAADLPWQARIEALATLAEAVQHAHARLVVHRDIKPANVLIDAAGQPRLLDFGIARLLGEGDGLTRAGVAPLTLEFAAPEQLRGEPVGVACDVYALGLLGFVMLAGESPFAAQRQDSTALMAAILQGRVARPSALATAGAARALRGDLDAILLRATATAPEERYASAQAFADDLRRHLQGEPVQARPARWGYVARRWLRRHWAGTLAAVAVLSSLIGATAWSVRAAQSERLAALRAQSMYDFVRKAINPVDADTADLARGDMKLGDLVVEAAGGLSSRLAAAPDARLQLALDLAPMVGSLGKVDQSVALLEGAMRDAAVAFGPDSPHAHMPAVLLAQHKYEAKGDWASAYQLVDKAVQAFERSGFDDPRRLGEALMYAGYFGWRAHKPLRAEDLDRLTRGTALLREHAEDGGWAEKVAMVEGDAGRYRQAMDVALDGARINERRFGRVHWKTAAMLEQAGIWANRVGDKERSVQLHRDAMAIHRQVWPEGHFLLARARLYLAGPLTTGAHREEAARLLDEALAIVDRPEWRDNKRVLRESIEFDQLDLAVRAERWRAAQSICDRYEVGRTRLNAILTFKLLHRCAQTAARAGQTDLAQRWLAPLEELIAKAWSNLPARRALLQLRRADLAAASGQPEAASALYAEVLALAPPEEALTRAEAWRGWSLAAPREVDARALQAEVRDYAARPGEHWQEIQGLLSAAQSRLPRD